MKHLRLRTSLLLPLLACPLTAEAALVGSPVAEPDLGVFSLGPYLDYEEAVMRADGCTGEACQGVRRATEFAGRLAISPLRGVGLFGDLGLVKESMLEADYAATGRFFGAGARLALPVKGHLYLAAQGQVQSGNAQTYAADGTTIEAEGDWLRWRAAGMIALAPSDHNACLYLGATYHPSYTHNTRSVDYDVDYAFQPVSLVGAVLGGQMASAVLNLPWGERDVHMKLAVEARIEAGFALGGMMAVGF